MPTAEELFTETFGRFITNWKVISSLREVANLGIPHAEQALTEHNASAVEEGSDEPPGEFRKALVRAAMTNLVITNARAAVDAASLVFAQSVLDDSAWSYCKVCALVSPQDWEPLIGAKKVDFEQLRLNSPEVIRDELVGKKLKQLERESLLAKLDLLFTLCQPAEGFKPVGNYAYDRVRLDRIDGYRHLIIHSSQFGSAPISVEEDLEFISKTGYFLMALVKQRYGVSLHPLLEAQTGGSLLGTL